MKTPSRNPSREPLRSRRRHGSPWLVLAVALAGTVAVTVGYHRFAGERDRKRFEHEATRLQDLILDRIDTQVVLLRGVAGLFSLGEEISVAEFKAYATRLRLDEYYRGSLGVGYSRKIAADEVEAVLAGLREDGRPGFEIHPADPRAEYHAIVLLEPQHARNALALGYDMTTEPTQREAIERARDVGNVALSGRVTLVQDIDAVLQPGFLLYAPVYRGGTIPAGVEERRASFLGVSFSPCRAADLLAAALARSPDLLIGVEIFDGAAAAPEALLFDNANSGQFGHRARFSSARTIEIAGRPWLLHFESLPAYEVLIDQRYAILIPFFGVLLSLALAAISWREAVGSDSAMRGQRLLARERERFRITLGSIADGVVATDAEGRVEFMNPVAEALCEVREESALGRPSEDVLHFVEEHGGRDLGSPIARALAQAQVSSPANHALLVRRNGSRVAVEMNAAPILEDGATRGAVLVFRDITERRSVEEEKAQLLASERAARGEAERQSRVKDEFVATLSHELRTPLNAVLGWAQVLRATANDPAQVQSGLEIIERNARLQSQMIEDLLDVSRIVSGKVRLDVQRVAIAEVIESAMESLRPAAAAKHIRLSCVLDPRTNLVHGDPARLAQIVWNLASNALKFTPKGGHVQVLLERVESQVEIRISDDGSGISPEFLPHVFERFRQEDPTTTRKAGGLGLGLSIVKHLVELHGGTIHASSAGDGLGATFRVRLPIAIAHGHAGAPQLFDGRTLPAPETKFQLDIERLRGLRVLVVDDEADSRALVSRILTDCGVRVREAGSVAEALETFRLFRPDVVLSDIGMPERDGFDLVRAIRLLPAEEGGTTPAAALTALARSQDRTHVLVAGFQVHIAKPVEAAELVAVVLSLSILGIRRSDPGLSDTQSGDGAKASG